MYTTTAHTALFVILLLFTKSIVLADDSGTTANLVSINVPTTNQVLTPGQQFFVQYTINGNNKNNDTQQQQELSEIPNYPSSMDVIFRWTDKNNSQHLIELTALNGLNTDAYPAGLKNQVYSHRWKLPNCHFFRRYMPSEWSFCLIFRPKYPAPPSFLMINDKAKIQHPVVPLGPEQASMTVPINVLFNATLMTDHHKGC